MLFAKAENEIQNVKYLFCKSANLNCQHRKTVDETVNKLTQQKLFFFKLKNLNFHVSFQIHGNLNLTKTKFFGLAGTLK